MISVIVLVLLSFTVMCASGQVDVRDEIDPVMPVVDCGVLIPRGFDPADPVVIAVYTNMSSRCPAYEYIPLTPYERLVIGPDVMFDEADAKAREDEGDFGPEGQVEIPPLASVSVPFRVGNKYEIPTNWNRMWISPLSRQNVVCRWFAFDRTGRALSNWTARVYSSDRVVANVWRLGYMRDRIRSDIERYADLEGRQTGGLPARIGTKWTPSGLTGAIAGVDLIGNSVVYDSLTSSFRHEGTTRNAGSSAVDDSTRGWQFQLVIAGVLCCAITVGTMVLLRRRRS